MWASEYELAFWPAALLLGFLAMIEERGLIEGDTTACGACREEALCLLVMRAGHWKTVWLIHPDGDFYQRYKEKKTDN